jgi:alkaline phosphatase
VFRFHKEQLLALFPNYQVGADGYPQDPDPTRKLLIGWAAATDHYENWVSNRVQQESAIVMRKGTRMVAVPNPLRDAPEGSSEQDVDNKTVSGVRVPGFLVSGTIENGQAPCDPVPAGDLAAVPLTIGGHTATDVPLSASGPGAILFTGTYDNTDVMRKLLLTASGCLPSPAARAARR